MKELLKSAFACAAVSSVAFAAVPVLDSDSVSVGQLGSRTVVISYKLNAPAAGEAEPAIVTVDILTNAVGGAAVSVGGEHLQTLSGDVNRLVKTGEHKILWKPHKEGMPEFALPAAQVTARLTLWSTNAPPTYWMVDLSSADAMKDRFCDRFYPNKEQIPGGVTNITYKRDWLVFRRIPSRGVTWREGATKSECSSAGAEETPRYVTFSYEYYMAIYELTRAQLARVCQEWQYKPIFPADGATEEDFASVLPATGTPKTYQFQGWDLAASFDPAGSRVRTLNSILKNFANSLGLNADFPTHAEFEYASRAGSSSLYVSGDKPFGDYAWYSSNNGGTSSVVLHEVGLKLPNAWGLYDIQGNAPEFSLDWGANSRSSDPVWDPMGPAKTENYRSTFGGHCGATKENCRVSRLGWMAPAQATGSHTSNGAYNVGMRIVVVLP